MSMLDGCTYTVLTLIYICLLCNGRATYFHLFLISVQGKLKQILSKFMHHKTLFKTTTTQSKHLQRAHF